ncbi:predicted protein [Phaeodactylum tricornutum CCAP 1055/1]|uniref:SWIM-type domain-containing protein n=1 Tax=Phaeodactylum tricornutum (strain CCAP 1055/1) TaxID=556484 RepID=B7G3N8_PHATC|nr:predicted protein [Phaeodactylum tricornutum CCAP 1055/1]XP_002185602.1 predicted protein [Phaeodactylum tricornutum CCAP 1055/1]EEC42900.1 predicted protein [Phaeodactylum tricornutum CCAP 1055/1]EEC47036.1 predicted protein [Phaeodactylum tricornutum CCAP 1055/1]|eukprot:XP_002181822.1 predicted protein [Phaeodactylum tricornutum CCAP 1055/1]
MVQVEIMSKIYGELVAYPPLRILQNGKEHDPYVVVDEAIEKFGAAVKDQMLTKEQALVKVTKVANSIDWLPTELKELVDAHCRKDSDVDNDGYVNKMRLSIKANELFGKMKASTYFVNFYQLKQVASRFAAHWGFVVVSSGNKLSCFFAKSSTKPQHSTECHPGVKEQRLARKAAGITIGGLDLTKVNDIVTLIAAGNINACQMKSLLKDHVPEHYAITASDICNIRKRAVKYSIEQTPINIATAQKLIDFVPLDEDETIISKDDDVSREKVAEFMRQVLQDTGEGWKALAFLEKVKSETIGFDFRVHYDIDVRPIGIVWITKSMRKAWIRFGSTIYLDAMKRKMNSLHWPYIGPVAMDHEMRVVPLCESICLGETLAAYAFALNSLEQMEPRRKLASIRLIYADCFLTDALLPLVGLKRPSTTLAWDSFHLKSKVWPEYFGPTLFDQLKASLGKMLYGKSRKEYDEAYQEIAQTLAHNPAKLEYVKGLYDHPERFAHHFIKTIPGNLGKSSSQPAESNHSSVVARVGPGSSQDIVKEISALLYRRQDLANLHEQEDARYELLSFNRASKTKTTTLLHDLSDAGAHKALSKRFFKDYWCPLSEEGKSYTHLCLPCGSHQIFHMDTPKLDDFAIVIKKGERCTCSQQKEFGGMCLHEYALHNHTFELSLFPERMLQPHLQTAIRPTSSNNDTYDHYGCNDDDLVLVKGNNANEVNVDEVNIHADTRNEPSSSEDDSIPLATLAGKCSTNTKMQPQKKQKCAAVTHAEATCVAAAVVDYIVGGKSEMSMVLYSSLQHLLEIARGTSARSAASIVQSASLAVELRRKHPALHQPVAGPEANTVGRTRSKRLVSKVMATYGGTSILRDLGRRITKEELPRFRQTELCCSQAISDGSKLSSLITANKPVLISLPRHTKWLVIHGLYNLSGSLAAAKVSNNVGVEVTCYGNMGTIMEGLIEGAASFDHRVATYSTVTDWIATSALTGMNTMTRLIASNKFNSLTGSI